MTENINSENVILIGMPGAGKSTCGVLAAKLLLKNFFDTDLLIQSRERKRLQQIIDESGLAYLKRPRRRRFFPLILRERLSPRAAALFTATRQCAI